MASIRDITEQQLFQGIIRGPEFTNEYAVCKVLLDIKETKGHVLGLFLCKREGLFIGAQLLEDDVVVKTIGPAKLSSFEDAYGDMFTNVGMVGQFAALFIKEEAEDLLDIDEEQLFKDHISPSTPPKESLGCKISSAKLLERVDGRPTEMLFGVCDKIKWINVNDSNRDKLIINCVFGPGWVAMGCTITDTNNEALVTFEPINIKLDDADFYKQVGSLCNAVAGNAVMWMLQQP